MMNITFFERFITFADMRRRFEKKQEDDLYTEGLSLINDLKKHNKYCSAGLVAEHGITVFGGDKTNRMVETANEAIACYRNSLAINEGEIQTCLSYLGLSKIYHQFARLNSDNNNDYWKASITYHRQVAEILESLAENDKNPEDFLIRGAIISTDLDSNWEFNRVNHEIKSGETGWGTLLRKNISSAANTYIDLLDFAKAHSILEKFEDIPHPHLNGWKWVCKAYNDPEKRSEFFLKASESFNNDSQEYAKIHNIGSWSGFSQQCLSPYYESRAILESKIQDPEVRLSQLKNISKIIDPDKGGWVYGPARRLGLIVKRLGEFLETSDESIMTKLIKEYRREIRHDGHLEEGAEELLEGLELLVKGFEGFKNNPTEEIAKGRISSGLSIIERLPWQSHGIVLEGLTQKIGKSALEICQGTSRFEVIKLLESIKYEKKLQQFIFKLLVAERAKHIKIAHGPVEFGKDIVSCIDNEGILELHIYALKCGDINSKSWAELKEQIDQIYTIPTKDAVIKDINPTHFCVHILFNGQIKQMTEEKVFNWIDYLKKERNWKIKVINIVRLADWVINKHMVMKLKNFVE